MIPISYYSILIFVLCHILYTNGQRYVQATGMAWCDNDLEVYLDGNLLVTDEGRSYRLPISFQLEPRTPNTVLRFHCKDLGGGGGFSAILFYLGRNYTTNYPITDSMFDLISSDDNITALSTLRYEQREGVNYSARYLDTVGLPVRDLKNLAPYWIWNDNILNTMIFEFDFSKILEMTSVYTICNNMASISISLLGLSGTQQEVGRTDDSTWPATLNFPFMVASESTVEVVCTDTTGNRASFMGRFDYQGKSYYTSTSATADDDWHMLDGTVGWSASCSQYNAEYLVGNDQKSHCPWPEARALWSNQDGKGMWQGDQNIAHRFRITYSKYYNYSRFINGPYTLSPTPSPTDHIICDVNSTEHACNRYETEELVGVCEDVHDLYSDSRTKYTGLSPFQFFCIIFGSIVFCMMMCELIFFLIWRYQNEDWQKEHDWYNFSTPQEKIKTIKKSIGRVMNWIFHFIVLFWCVLATFYGINQLYKLSYSNFWCDGPEKTIEEIHEYNYENQCKTGDRDSCYQTDAILDFYKVRTDNPADLYKSEQDIKPENVTYAILFFILAVIFLLLSILHLIKLIKSCKNEIDTGCCECCICFKRNHAATTTTTTDEKQEENKDENEDKKKDKNKNKKSCCQKFIGCDCRKEVELKVQDEDEEEDGGIKAHLCGCCNKNKDEKLSEIKKDNDIKEDNIDADAVPKQESCMDKTIACPKKAGKRVVRFYKENLEIDSNFSVQLMIFMKFFNIYAQIVYLFALGGTTLNYVLSGKNKEVILAEYPEFIFILSVVIFLDCLSVCILWFLYGCLPNIFYAHTFKFLNIFVDLAFKLIYTLFPIIIHGTVSHLGLFQFKTFGAFFGPFVAMLFMVWKIHKVLGQSRDLAERGGIINHQFDNTLGAYDDIEGDGYGGMPGMDGDGEELEIGGHSEGKENYRRHWNVDNYMEVSVYRWDKNKNDKYGKDYAAKLSEKERLENARKIWIQKHKRKMEKAKREGRLDDLAELQKELDAKLAEDYSIKEDEDEKNGFGGLEQKSEEPQVFKYSWLHGPYWDQYDKKDDQTKRYNNFIFHCDDVEEELRKMLEAQKERKEKEEEMKKREKEFEEKKQKEAEEEKNKLAKKKKRKNTKDKKEKDKKELEVALEMTETNKSKKEDKTDPELDDKKSNENNKNKAKKRKTSKAVKSDKSDKSDKKAKKSDAGDKEPTIPSMNAPKPMHNEDNDDNDDNKNDKKTKKKRKTTKTEKENEEKTNLNVDGDDDKKTTEKSIKSDDDKKKRKASKAGDKKRKSTKDGGEKSGKKYEAVTELSPSPSDNNKTAFPETVDNNNNKADEFDEFEKIICRIIWCNRLKRCWLFIAALLYLAIGLIIIILVNLDLNESQEFCTQIPVENLFNLSVSEWELIMEHPDLALYNEACKIQVFELFGSYPCNCRLFDLYLADNIDSICILNDHYNNNISNLTANHYITESLTKWTMIERYLLGSQHAELSCLRYDANSIIDLNDEELFQAKYMQVMALGTVQISAISPAISQYTDLQALFIQGVDGFVDNTTMPYNEIGNLPLKVLHLRGIDADTNTFPSGLCNLKQDLMYFGFEWGKITNVNNCLGEFNKLLYLKFPHNRITNIPWDLLHLQDIRRISFPGNAIQNNVFLGIDKNINFSSNLIELDFLWNHFCENVTQYTNNELIINSCEGVCTKDYNSLYCNNNMIGDGVCQPECNTKTCLYDEGDCIQLCNFTACNIDHINDGICNQECNNIDCRWDGGDCEQIVCTMPDYKNSYIEYPLWSHIDNGNCDLDLLESNCSLYEYESDCNVCSATCDAMYLPFIKVSQGDEIITVDDWCNEEIWVLVQQQLNKGNKEIKTCQFFIDNYRFDLNGNDVTGFHEFLYLFGYNMEALPQGIEQADCRQCMDNPDLYYE